MAEITNKARTRRPTMDMNAQDDYGITDENYEPMARIYDDSYNGHNEKTIDSVLTNSDGNVPQAMEDDLDSLRVAARQYTTGRKPMVDWNTSNKTFIDVHNDLKRLGVKNNVFMLKLYDRTLVGVDPFSAALPIDIQIRIYLECTINPWYFLREVARIPADGMPIEPGSGVQYELDRNNLAAWYLFIHNVDIYTSKPRQTGKTQDALLKLNYAYHFGSSSSTILFFNKDLALSKENLARLKDQRDLFPSYLQMKIAFDEEGAIVKGTDNITTMKNPLTGNEVKVMPCANSREMATRLGRGYTAPLMMFDEFDFTNFNTEIVNASVFAYATASKNAIANHSCSGRLFLSTPGDLSTRDGKAATDFIRGTKEIKGMFIWNDIMFDDDIEKIKAEITSPKYNGIVFIEHTWQQLRKPMAWYEKMCNLAAYNQEVILREVLLQRLSGSSMSPFTRDQQLYLSSHKRTPIGQINVRYDDTVSTIWIYEKLKRNITYIIGIDPSDGLGDDSNAMIVIHPKTLKVVAEYKCPYISSKSMSKVICAFMDEHCPNALIVIENNRGRGLIERILDSHYAHRLWYDSERMTKLIETKTDEYGGMPRSTMIRKVTGFSTNRGSRNPLFQTLETMVQEYIDTIYSENLVNELLTLVRKPPTNRIEAAQGEHDDCVMAYLIALHVYLNSKNLHEFGIKRAIVYEVSEEDMQPEKESEEQFRQRVRSQMSSIPDQYKSIFEDFVNQRDPVRDARDYYKQVRQIEDESLQQTMYHPDIDGVGKFDDVLTGDYRQMDTRRKMAPQVWNQQEHDYYEDSPYEKTPDQWNDDVAGMISANMPDYQPFNVEDYI